MFMNSSLDEVVDVVNNTRVAMIMTATAQKRIPSSYRPKRVRVSVIVYLKFYLYYLYVF